MDVASLRQMVIASNVANVNTPGYRQREVAFEEALSKAIAKDDMRSALAVEPEIVFGTGTATRADGNNVDIDREMTNLTKNTLLFRTASQILAVQLRMMRSAITGR